MKKIHFISHTHWDREWLRSSDASRIKLTYLFEQLIEIMENNPEYKYFTFDGQTAALEDFLELRPHRKEQIKKYVSQGRLFIGPWYTQPDMFLASGESLIRNLLIGSQLAKEMGHCMNVGWIPDAFGQIEKTPQLFSKLGFDGIFAWRGFDYENINDSIFKWRAPNGDTLLTVHFPLGYGYYRYLPLDKEQAYKDIWETIDKTKERFKDEHILFMGGSDYAVPKDHIPGVIGSISEQLNQDGYEIEMSNPEKYMKEVKETLKVNERDLQVYQGEARSAALGRIHAGISSTRIDIKNALKHYETMLSSIIEPWSVCTSYLGGENYQELMTYFWKIIFKNQFHDSAYSSSPDTINQTVENRLLNLRHGLNELLWMNIRYLKDHVDFSSLKEDDEALILYNPLPYKRNDTFFVSMILKSKEFTLYDESGVVVPYVIHKTKVEINQEIETYNGIINFHDGGEVLEGTKYLVQISLDGKILPSMGYKILKLVYEKPYQQEIYSDLKHQDTTFENKYLKVEIEQNGKINVYDKVNKKTYHDAVYFIESGDDGDEYNYSPPYQDKIIDTRDLCPEVQCIEDNEFEVAYQLSYALKTPLECLNHYRSEEEVISSFDVILSLKKESKQIDFKTIIDNHAKDHRIRAVIQDIHSHEYNQSQDHFGYTVRCNHIPNQIGLENGATEEVLPLYTMQKFVRLVDSQMALITKGSCEYEIIDNHQIALTLLRSVGKFGKADLKIRPGRSSGYRLDAPSSQMIKVIRNEFSIAFQVDGEGDLYRRTNLYNSPAQYRHVNNLKSHKGDLNWEKSFFEISQNIEIMAMKKSEDGQFNVIRLLNGSSQNLTDVTLTMPHQVQKCYLSNVKEEMGEELIIHESQVIIPKITSQDFITLLYK